MTDLKRNRLALGVGIFTLLIIPAMASAQGTLFVEGNNVGIGTDTPSQLLNVFATSGDSLVEVETQGDATAGEQAGFRFVNGGPGGPEAHRWDIRAGGVGNLIYNYNGGSVEFTYKTNGDLSISGTLSEGSSRTAKHAIDQVEPLEVLNKVMELPISTWSYNSSPDVRHLGPMAEDFYETFGLGVEPTSISAIDRDGVALAALQGLKAEKDADLRSLREENARLRAELTEVREIVQSLADQK